MTREEAVAAAKELGAHHADRATHRWLPREKQDGGWEVAKVALPPGMRVEPLKETVESQPRPPSPTIRAPRSSATSAAARANETARARATARSSRSIDP